MLIFYNKLANSRMIWNFIETLDRYSHHLLRYELVFYNELDVFWCKTHDYTIKNGEMANN